MANYQKNSLLACILITSVLLQADNYITFKPWHGRLGDQLWNICKSLLLADKYSLPFIFKPFSNADKFPSQQHSAIQEESKKKIIKVFYEDDIKKNLHKENILFLTNFYTRPNELLYNYCLDHKQFHNKLRSLFTPNTTTNRINLPNDKITVALHVRKGSKTDPQQSSLQEYVTTDTMTNYVVDQQELFVASSEHKTNSSAVDKRYPLKFPPHQYYIDAIKKLSELLHHKPLYVHLFTDHHNPEMLVKKIKQLVDLPNIEWQARSNKTKQEITVFDDFYNMIQCNCLIRSDSSFSKVIQLLGNYQTIIYPINGTWYDKKLIIDQVGIVFIDKQ